LAPPPFIDALKGFGLQPNADKLAGLCRAWPSCFRVITV
jgi:hypothetical protein